MLERGATSFPAAIPPSDGSGSGGTAFLMQLWLILAITSICLLSARDTVQAKVAPSLEGAASAKIKRDPSRGAQSDQETPVNGWAVEMHRVAQGSPVPGDVSTTEYRPRSLRSYARDPSQLPLYFTFQPRQTLLVAVLCVLAWIGGPEVQMDSKSPVWIL
jgi:hypothetical protein